MHKIQHLCELPGVRKVCNKGIRDAGSTADFRILFEVFKFKNLEIWKIWKILEHLENFRTFGKVFKIDFLAPLWEDQSGARV